MSPRRRLLATATALLFGSGAASPAFAQRSPGVQSDARVKGASLREKLDDFWAFLDLQCRDPDHFGDDPQTRKQQAQQCCDSLPDRLKDIEGFHQKLPMDEGARNALRSGYMQLFECSALLENKPQAEDALAFVSAVSELSADERNRLEALELGELSEKLRQNIASRPKGQLELRCTQECDLWLNWVSRIDIRPKADGSAHAVELPFGRYIVALEDRSRKSGTRSIVRTLTISKKSTSIKLALANDKPTARPRLTPRLETDAPLFPVISPIVPRTVTQSGLGAGLLGVAAGSALLAIDGYCKKNGISCKAEDKLETRLAGGIVLGIGMTLFISTIAVLIAERVRGKREFSRRRRTAELIPPVASRSGFAL